MLKVLIITYYWPPSGGAGVQRWLKFAGYLPEYGCEPVILTVDPGFAAYPVIDTSLEKEVPQTLKIFRTRAKDYFAVYRGDRSKIPSAGFAANPSDSLKDKIFRFIRGNFFIPDPRKGWNRHAYIKACRLIEEMGIKNVITTSPPHSTQLIGLKLKKKYPSLNWIADLRDPWTDIYYYSQFYPTPLSRAIDLSFEKSVLKHADKIITVGESLSELFSSKTGGTGGKISVITNGFDDKDFNSGMNIDPVSFTITYVGTLSDSYPAGAFAVAFAGLVRRGVRMKLRFVGTVTPKQKKMLESEIQSSQIEFLPYAVHSDAVTYMKQSSALLLIIPDHPGNRSIITGKLFEYLAACRPVICLGPLNGDAAAILSTTGHGKTFQYTDIEGISDYISELQSDQGQVKLDLPAGYSRKELTAKVIPLLVK